MEHFGEEQSPPAFANGSGSGAGARREPRRAHRDEPPAMAPAMPLVVIDPEEPAPGEEARSLRPPILPTQPNDVADVERWERPRDLVSIGEVLVEMTRRPDGAYQPAVAGDAYNTLFYAARLGLRAGVVTAVGDDLFTPMIIERIDAEGIDLSQVQRLSNRRNGLYFIEHDSWGERHFHYWREHSAATETMLHADVARTLGYLADAHFVLVTGVTLAVMKEPDRLRDLLERLRGRATVVLDGNYRPRLWAGAHEYRFRIETLLPLVDVYLPSRDDVAGAWRTIEPIEHLRAASDAGVTTIVMKDGARGCSMLVDGELVAVPAIEAHHVVDTTGAGDAFNAGMIAGLLRGSSLEEACVLAQRVAARSVMVPGAIDPAFSPHAIDAGWR